jgi:DNA-binding CsgD family transcriptional regulator
MPVRAARSSMRGLPPWGLGGSGGRSGSMVSHISSVTSSLAMFSGYPLNGFVRLTKYAFSVYEPTPPAASVPEEPQVGSTQPAALTRREQAVANLIGRRFTSRQIASDLHISEHTVDRHVANILKKLNLHSREQIGAKMVKQQSHPF